MCAIFGFLNYGKKISHKVLTKLLRELSIAAEVRGTDATGISYVKNDEMVTFKKARPAHKVRLYFPKETMAVIGHTRFTTQGSEKQNYNNHPFESEKGFALAHNGVLYNDKELRKKYMLPDTKIETDSYIAVQLLENQKTVDFESIKTVAEIDEGSFVFTILRNDNMLFLVKGSNPITLLHFQEYGLYLYASTSEILKVALKNAKFTAEYENIAIHTGDIVRIGSDGKLSSNTFEIAEPEYDYRHYFSCYDAFEEDENYENDLLSICDCYGVDRKDVELLLEYGYTADEIE
ncbi:MAG: glucosamine 6-phosphate synthetase, partial [Oscillospiraceae bacterium]|nr:glucosamine 6-phosphate synthetase [Oscillospiraceae bacterium]